MSRKKHQFITAEVCIERFPREMERAHLLEHVHFLEERTTDLETKVEILRDLFTMVLELDTEEDEDENEAADFFASLGRCLWNEDSEDGDDEDQ
jgi:hypothetical protein